MRTLRNVNCALCLMLVLPITVNAQEQQGYGLVGAGVSIGRYTIRLEDIKLNPIKTNAGGSFCARTVVNIYHRYFAIMGFDYVEPRSVETDLSDQTLSQFVPFLGVGAVILKPIRVFLAVNFPEWNFRQEPVSLVGRFGASAGLVFQYRYWWIGLTAHNLNGKASSSIIDLKLGSVNYYIHSGVVLNLNK